MPLKIELKPFERLLIGGAAIRNGSRRSSFVIETMTKFLRESDIITESEADTACKRLYLTLTVLYLSDDVSEIENLFVAQASELLEAVPSTAPYVRDINAHVAARDFYRAMKRGKDLIQYEASLADRLAQAPDSGSAD
ncbi:MULTISPECIES: flagellar biosynthesis repressor FlbT [Methylobacterium]|uniref:Flagellum biosynthesis repressor protein FlbT n=1 Tax=Methylobacterium bullatum TaxID=570505 RepID=A0AAV4Z695_9HYPH|nr:MULTISPECIES: flagellar biosynthesis repressor FlbT [Methylobacterium]MBD8904689.1 flagellar protein FlbT [Methylobacterium bullatum]TXN33092.1 flagellar protein FlbT [Methylobacterium sp. WL19]GJD39481.1 flagellum biosynthesis repressor protein FlbT [Methylobacterium bullatum]